MKLDFLQLRPAQPGAKSPKFQHLNSIKKSEEKLEESTRRRNISRTTTPTTNTLKSSSTTQDRISHPGQAENLLAGKQLPTTKISITTTITSDRRTNLTFSERKINSFVYKKKSIIIPAPSHKIFFILFR